MDQLRGRLENLRTLETELWTEHSARQRYYREANGLSGSESTDYGRAAAALGELLDGIEDLVAECIDAEAVAYACGQAWGEKALIRISTVMGCLDRNLSESYP